MRATDAAATATDATEALEVVEPGLLTSVQDATGRMGWRDLGVPVAGAADAFSARLANRLVGNPDGAAVLEISLLGPSLRLLQPATVAIAGADLGAEAAGRHMAPGAAARLASGTVLRFGRPRRGARAYLALAGGLAVEPVLGSLATDLRSGFGGLDGRPLRAGDRLWVGVSREAQLRRWIGVWDPPGEPIRVLAGPQVDRFADGALQHLCAAGWTVSAAADRAGVRLEGEPISHAGTRATEVESMGLPLGAVQVPADGRPMVMLADRPVTGGYPVLAVVARADIGRVAQLATGDQARFRLIEQDEAIAALRSREAQLDALEPLDADDPGASWAGSLG